MLAIYKFYMLNKKSFFEVCFYILFICIGILGSTAYPLYLNYVLMTKFNGIPIIDMMNDIVYILQAGPTNFLDSLFLFIYLNFVKNINFIVSFCICVLKSVYETSIVLCCIYPMGLVSLIFLCIILLNPVYNVLNKKKLKFENAESWYKNILILRVIYVYNFIFFIIGSYHVIFTKFYYYKPFSNFDQITRKVGFISFDKFSVISILFISLFFLIFIRISALDLEKYLNLNNLLMLLMAVLSCIFLIMLKDVFLLYLTIIVLSLSLYPLISLNKKSHGNVEAVSKYFFLGSFSSGLMLYGITIIYREFKTLSYSELKRFIALLPENNHTYALVIGLIFIIFGFFFKLSIVPLQNWTPDVYLGAPTIITCFLATLIKFSVYSAFFRFYYGVVVNFYSNNIEFKNFMLLISLSSIIVGAVGALDQYKIKRFIGFTTINQMGFILLGLSLQNLFGFVASFIYLYIYIILSLILFCFVLHIKNKKSQKLVYLSDLTLFFRSNRLAAMVFILLIFSLAGMPPTIGFYMKLLILKALVISGYLKLAIIVLIVNMLSIFYYLRIVKIIFFDAETLVSTKEKVTFTLYDNPITELKSIKEIFKNSRLFSKLILYVIRQTLFYGIIITFLSGLWYFPILNSDFVFSVLADIWTELHTARIETCIPGHLSVNIKHFLILI